MIACASVSADLYTYTDEAGVLHLSDTPIDARYRLTLVEPKPAVVSAAASATSITSVMMAPAAAGAVSSHAGNPYPAHLQPLIERISAAHGVAPALVRAVIQAESNYNPRAVSPKGAQGLMQLMPATAQRFGVTDAFDPEQNVQAGVRYLAELMTMFKNNLTLALAAYNAGENAVVQHGHKVPPYQETDSDVL
ncbi:MAG: transglycosylase SLT domain-containing protein [Burkholderiales bacterium]